MPDQNNSASFNPASFASLLLPGAMSFLPSLLAHLFGSDPQARLRAEIAKLTSAGNVGKTTNQFYQNALGSPAFSQAQGAIATGANATGGQIASNLAQRGIGTSGTGAILSGLVPSIVGGQTSQLRTTAFNSAQQQAMEQIRQQIQALMGTSGPSQATQLFSGGLQSFAPFLQQFLKNKYPGTFGGMPQTSPSG